LRIIPFLFLSWSIAAQAQWKNQTDAGLVVNHGNSRSQSLNAKQDSAYQWDKNTLGATASYLKSSSSGVLSALQWAAALSYERALNERLSARLSQGVESDRFAGYLQRYNTDLGPKYVLYRSLPDWLWLGEAGYRFTRERSLSGARSSYQKARVFTEVDRQWNPTASSKVWVEYLPNFSVGTDWQLNAEFSTSANLNSVLALKVAYLYKYDHQLNPGATRNSDTVLTTALVARY
jgi:putative salt-induced outer membrane protein YdiY